MARKSITPQVRMPNPKKTLVIDNFRGSMTDYLYGDINSGRQWTQTVSGINPFQKPGQLTWSATPIQIDPNSSVITDLIMAAKERVESGILYVYAVGHTGRVYKIQVNNPATFNPDYDNPVLLTTLTANAPTFTRGASIEFYGATSRIYIGSDVGLTQLDFNGANETFVGNPGTWTQLVPRPIKQFLGSLYIGNGSNLAVMDTTLTITSYTKLTPGFPSDCQVRDIDVSPDGNYVETVVSSLPLADITSASQDTSSTASTGSYIFKWNGSDAGYTSYTSFPSYNLSANILFQNYNYTFGTDQFGTAVFSPNEKILFIPESPAPMPNAVVSSGNLLFFLSPLYFNGVLEADLMCWGSLDFEVGHPVGWWDLMFLNAKAPETDIVRVPMMLPISNTGFGSSSNGYTGNIFGTSKLYFSTLETSSSPTTKYRFYKWEPVGSAPAISPVVTPVLDAVYETQSQMFSKKVSVSEVRVYGEPWIAGNSFTIDLIGSNGSPIPNASYTLTAGSNLTIGDDFAWYGVNHKPTYCIGVRITNLGDTNFTVNKIEIDWGEAGK